MRDDATGARSVVLRDRRDEDGVRHLAAAWRDGSVVIEGHDLGRGVERVFGHGLTEYEWTWTVEVEALPAMLDALGAGSDDDPLLALRAWSHANDAADPGVRLREAGVAVRFWSRIGD